MNLRLKPVMIKKTDFEGSSTPKSGFCQEELNDLIRGFGLTKKLSELLASRLAEKNCLLPDTKIVVYRKREKEFLVYLTEENKFFFCNNVRGLLSKLGVLEYTPCDLRLFIDSSKRNLKFTTVSGTIATLLDKISYRDHQWVIYVDLKIVNFLLGQQCRYTKFPSFICLWESRDKYQYLIRRQWPSRETIATGQINIITGALVDQEKIILLPLHIKLDLMKQFVKALNKDGACFRYICKKFPSLTMERLKAGIFDEPQIGELLKDQRFEGFMEVRQLLGPHLVWLSIISFNHKAPNYVELVKIMLTSFSALGCSKSIKVHYLHNHLDRFSTCFSNVSDEQGERFHQEIRVMEERYR